ncbi:antitoxin [Streptomyces sp. NPDC052701]|uniref:antitoxin n=1 Tax=Streptomyces sp. NPDC052701 TaxID=3155533 RepID=UPI00343FB3B6
MGIFDKLKQQAQKRGKEPSDTAERKINERTGGKYEDQVDTGQRRAEEQFGVDRDRPERP